MYKGMYLCFGNVQYSPLGLEGCGVKRVGCTFMIASFWLYFLSPSVELWKKFDVHIELTRKIFLFEVEWQLPCLPYVFP